MHSDGSTTKWTIRRNGTCRNVGGVNGYFCFIYWTMITFWRDFTDIMYLAGYDLLSHILSS